MVSLTIIFSFLKKGSTEGWPVDGILAADQLADCLPIAWEGLETKTAR